MAILTLNEFLDLCDQGLISLMSYSHNSIQSKQLVNTKSRLHFKDDDGDLVPVYTNGDIQECVKNNKMLYILDLSKGDITRNETGLEKTYFPIRNGLNIFNKGNSKIKFATSDREIMKKNEGLYKSHTDQNYLKAVNIGLDVSEDYPFLVLFFIKNDEGNFKEKDILTDIFLNTNICKSPIYITSGVEKIGNHLAVSLPVDELNSTIFNKIKLYETKHIFLLYNFKLYEIINESYVYKKVRTMIDIFPEIGEMSIPELKYYE